MAVQGHLRTAMLPLAQHDSQPRSRSIFIPSVPSAWQTCLRDPLQRGSRLPLFDQDVQERVGGDFSL
ncbi:hypothetical protein QC761_0107740 [Podospora bellae-mahoneyi]|uniref:Uncharacterized protein n=1 Tax=Podospora bellae-mahoneyi TaxID=2093777 RepID=A0ABR0F7V7_9PEZI|nr:hypothetical protein QC761_0107740 [Podospora bellae-mahoneyi]